MKILDYFITESEAANILSVNRNTIARWGREGKFDVQRIGRIGLIPKWQVELLKRNDKKIPAKTS
jgi:excisionase family DNA binding protein